MCKIVQLQRRGNNRRVTGIRVCRGQEREGKTVKWILEEEENIKYLRNEKMINERLIKIEVKEVEGISKYTVIVIAYMDLIRMPKRRKRTDFSKNYNNRWIKAQAK